MAHDVFISYSTVDQKIVEGLSAYLELQGIRCFVAYRDIPKGVVWAGAITEAIEHTKLMVVVFSEHFNHSKQVDREIELCIEEKEHPILTFKIQNASFIGAKKYYLKNLNWIDAFPNPEEFFGELCENIKRTLHVINDKRKAITNLKNTLNPKESESVMKLGEAAIQYELGEMYENSNKGTRNYTKAFECYLKAAEQGDASGQFNLGSMYEYGKGVVRDYAKAKELYRKAMEQGNQFAKSAYKRLEKKIK